MANIRCVKHPKNQKVLQTCENQLYQGKHPICQTSEKPKSAANIRKPALPWRTSDMPNIRKTKKCCKHPKISFSRANIRYVRHPKNQKVLLSCENQLYQGNTSDMSNIRKNKKCCKLPKSSFTMANIRCVKHPKNQNVVQTCENQLYQGKHPICQTSEKPKSAAIIQKPALPWQTCEMPKSAANMRKPALPGQTSDVSNIRKTTLWCKHAKSSFTRANIRYVKHPKNQKVLQTSENQLYQGKHPICQTTEKPKSAANMRKPALPGQTSDMSNIRKTKKCCKPAKTSFIRANIRYVKQPKNQKVLQTCENQLYQGKHPICQTSEKPKSAANIRKAAFRGQSSDKSNIRKTKKGCKHAKTSFTRTNIRYFKHPKNQNVVQTCENQLYKGKHPICQTSEKPKNAAIIRKPALPCQTSDMPNIRKTKESCKHPKSSFSRANFRYVKHPKNQKELQTCENQLYEGKHPICH